jgi:maltooligosyltrehalose synthase
MIPSATYRIQFRNGMTFDRAAALAPYLKDLGISHLYASPIFTATSGSTHGYDITDPNEIDPAIGGREGFDRMVKALRNAQIGLILDIVPNHMATSLENRWWRDVIEQGKNSAWAHYFDIDWTRPVTLPFLGDTFEAELESGALALKRDPETGKPAFVYYDQAWPLNPQTLATGEQLLTSPDRDAILALHEAQSWRLMSWREAPRQLSWRRFFEITGLIGVRVEDRRCLTTPTALSLNWCILASSMVCALTISMALPTRWGICSACARQPGQSATLRWKKSSPKASSCPPTGPSPAPQDMSLSLRWRKCWWTITSISCSRFMMKRSAER